MQVLLGMPRYTSQVAMPAAQAFFHAVAADSKLQVRAVSPATSLLTGCFNSIWALARNSWEAGQAQYFGMIHADVGAEIYWLDKLFKELEESRADIIGVTIPIKDGRGLTSTAVDDTGDHFRVRRLTMAQCRELPETFTEEHVPGLLLNTGLWLCKLGPWCLETQFHVEDCIIRQPSGLWAAGTFPEDWNFSRQCRKLGLRIAATRKVQVDHYGEHKWSNQDVWGWYTDLQNTLPGWQWPSDVTGWLAEEEGRELATLARGKRVLEIGSYCGRSTICIAQTAATVTCVDPFDARDCLNERRDTYGEFVENIRRYGVESRIECYQNASEVVLTDAPDALYDLVFIDGAHDRESVARDARLASRWLTPGGLLAFHDYNSSRDPGVTAAVNGLVANGATLLRVIHNLAVVRPVPTPCEVAA